MLRSWVYIWVGGALTKLYGEKGEGVTLLILLVKLNEACIQKINFQGDSIVFWAVQFLLDKQKRLV